MVDQEVVTKRLPRMAASFLRRFPSERDPSLRMHKGSSGPFGRDFCGGNTDSRNPDLLGPVLSEDCRPMRSCLAKPLQSHVLPDPMLEEDSDDDSDGFSLPGTTPPELDSSFLKLGLLEQSDDPESSPKRGKRIGG